MTLPRTFDVEALDRALAEGALHRARVGRQVSVCIPARNEARTVGAVVRAIRATLAAPAGGSGGLVDEVVVVDDGSGDRTAATAEAEGALVVPHHGPPGKGRAMAAGVEACRGDLIVFLDADVVDLDPRFVTRLLAPLLLHDDLRLVKGTYRRPLGDAPSGGGRVTELVARPLLELLQPDLLPVRQPLAGETAVPREVLEKLELEPDYGVEMGLLLDVAAIFGAESIGQVDLGVRAHRNRPLEELRPQATDVLRAALRRRGPLATATGRGAEPGTGPGTEARSETRGGRRTEASGHAGPAGDRG